MKEKKKSSYKHNVPDIVKNIPLAKVPALLLGPPNVLLVPATEKHLGLLAVFPYTTKIGLRGKESMFILTVSSLMGVLLDCEGKDYFPLRSLFPMIPAIGVVQLLLVVQGSVWLLLCVLP